MNKILSTIISLIIFGSIASAQLTEFSQGDILSAGAMNQNFKYLEDRFGGLNEKTVDCGTSGTGSGINAAIKDGYNSIIVKGICKENIKWRTKKGERGYLKLKGYSNDQTSDKIIDNSSSSNSVIELTISYLKIDNLIISGGTRGVEVFGNSLLWADNVTVESYTQRGINIDSSSVGWLGNVTVDGTKQSAIDEMGIRFGRGSNGYIYGTTTVKGNSSDSGGIVASGGFVWLDGTINLDSNKRSLAIDTGGTIGFSDNSNTTITNSTDYGIKVNYGKLWNNGTMTISDSSDGNWGISIDRSDAYLSNLTVTGGSGSDNLVGIYGSRLMLDNVTIKNHGGSLLDINRSNLIFQNTINLTNESSSDGCLVYIGDSNFRFMGTTSITGTNNSNCNALNIFRSKGEIDNMNVTSPSQALYAVSSDVRIKGGSFSSSGGNGISIREGSRFRLESGSSNLSITSSGSDALEVRSSYVKLDKGSNNLTISSTSSGDFDITNRSFSTLEIVDHTFTNIEVRDASNLIINSDATITNLTCTNTSNILKSGTVTNAGACSNAQ